MIGCFEGGSRGSRVKKTAKLKKWAKTGEKVEAVMKKNTEFNGIGRFMMEIARERQAYREAHPESPVIPKIHDWSGNRTFTRGSKKELLEAMKAGKVK